MASKPKPPRTTLFPIRLRPIERQYLERAVQAQARQRSAEAGIPERSDLAPFMRAAAFDRARGLLHESLLEFEARVGRSTRGARAGGKRGGASDQGPLLFPDPPKK